MARTTNKLSARTVTTITEPGRHSDGGGLYLVVDKPREAGSKTVGRRWVFLFRWQGRLREMGLGGVASVSLAEARKRADDARRIVAEGTNPIEARRVEVVKVSTFGEVADELIAAMEPSWRNEKHRAQWKMTLDVYAKPLRARPVDEIDTQAVLDVLRPIWATKPETASRLRGRIEAVLAAATAKGLRTGPNPALWRGHLDRLLPPRRKLTRGHHGAMPFNDVPAFVQRLRETEGMAASALEFVIYTAARSGEVLGATWQEIDMDAAVWTVPARRMKSGREHRVPLSAPALAILRRLALTSPKPEAWVFPGAKKDAPLSSMSMEMTLRRLGVKDAGVTVHGFRSSFRDWAGEVSPFPRDLAEQALAHVVGDATERAYRRGDALEKRRAMMEAWSAFVEGEGREP